MLSSLELFRKLTGYDDMSLSARQYLLEVISSRTMYFDLCMTSTFGTVAIRIP